MRQPRFSAVLFDLDGTMTDPFEGIARSVAHALADSTTPPPSEEELRAWIGPPLRDSFLLHLADEELATAAVARYRERYGTLGMLENEVYPGIPELLRALREAGVRLFVATSKIRVPTEGILAHFGLASFFEHVAAPDPADSAHKAEVIASLRGVVGADWERAVMVGDTVYDVEGARANGLPCIAVGYGYGSRESLTAAGALAIAGSVEELADLLLGEA